MSPHFAFRGQRADLINDTVKPPSQCGVRTKEDTDPVSLCCPNRTDDAWPCASEDRFQIMEICIAKNSFVKAT